MGYIGSHTAIELIIEEFDVVIVDNLSNAEKFMLDRIETIIQKQMIKFLSVSRTAIVLLADIGTVPAK